MLPMPDSRTDLDAKLEKEIQDALGDMSIDDILADEERPGGRPPGRAAHSQPKTERTMRTGTIVAVHGSDVIVEFGPRTTGICPLNLFEEQPKLGAPMEFIIERFDRDDEIYVLSRKGSVAKAEWESLEVGQTVEARCVGVNKGGLEMEVAQHRAFMPAGQVDIRHVDNLEQFVEQKLPCEVIEIDRQRGRIILSRRAHVQQERDRQREQTLAVIEVGQEVDGTVTTLKPYGAFVDIGGVDGLVHISDLSHHRIHDPSEVVKVGDKVRVRILKIDESENPVRISLGLKHTVADPFHSAANTLEEDATVTGRVTKIMDFGAFIEISPGVEGLVHISELSHEHVKRVDHVVKQGEIVTAKVLSIDRGKQRISLSIKALRQREEELQERRLDRGLEKLKARFGSDWGHLKGGLG